MQRLKKNEVVLEQQAALKQQQEQALGSFIRELSWEATPDEHRISAFCTNTMPAGVAELGDVFVHDGEGKTLIVDGKDAIKGFVAKYGVNVGSAKKR